MIFGFIVQPLLVVALGITLILGLTFQVLVGLRIIKFRPRTHLYVHKWTGYGLLALAAVHGFLAIVFVLGLRIG